MKIFYDNHIQELKKLINKKAKYQKVMLLFDETVSATQTDNIKKEIKEDCIFNCLDITKDISEIYNGYKMLIFMCSIDNLVKTQLDKSEFVCAYFLNEISILPCVLSNYKLQTDSNYLFVGTGGVDNTINSSIMINQFINYFDNTLTFTQSNAIKSTETNSLNEESILEKLNALPEDFQFFDVEIINKANIEYKHLFVVDLIVIDAFIVLFESVKQNNLQIVDCYKQNKDNAEVIDKTYATISSPQFIDVVKLNHNCLMHNAQKTKQTIMECFDKTVSKQELAEILTKLKATAKDFSNCIKYLYVYDIF